MAHLGRDGGLGPVVIRGTAPETWGPHIVGLVLTIFWWIGIVALFTNGQNGIAIIMAGPGLLAAVALLLNSLRTFSMIGKMQATVDRDGVTTPRFSHRWAEIIACDFIEQAVKYTTINPQKVVAAKEPLTSLVVTLKEVDAAGRPVQVGYTMASRHTDDLDEFRRAAREFAPAVDIRSWVTPDDYVLDDAGSQQFARQFAADGNSFVVRDKRGREQFRVRPDGIWLTADSYLSFADHVAIIAVTDVYTTSTNGLKTTERMPRVACVSAKSGPDGKPLISRLDYPGKYTPTMEQFLRAVHQLAPHIAVSDRRTFA